MIRDLKSLYVLTLNNKVEFFDTNLTSFVEKLNDFDSNSRNYDYYYREFKKVDFLECTNKQGEKYYLQKLL